MSARFADMVYAHHIIRSDGAHWVDGERDDSADRSWLTVDGSQIVLAPGMYDELLAVSRLATDEEAQSWAELTGPIFDAEPFVRTISKVDEHGASLSVLAQKADEISSTVARVMPGGDIYTTIQQTAEEVSQRVVKKGEVIAEINASQEGVLIAGKKIQLDGDTKIAGDFTVNGDVLVNGSVTEQKLGNVPFPKVIAAGTAQSRDYLFASPFTVPAGKRWLVFIQPYPSSVFGILQGYTRRSWVYECTYNLYPSEVSSITHNLYSQLLNVEFTGDPLSWVVTGDNSIEITNPDAYSYASGTMRITALPANQTWPTQAVQETYRQQLFSVLRSGEQNPEVWFEPVLPAGNYTSVKVYCQEAPPAIGIIPDLVSLHKHLFLYLVLEVEA